MHIEEPVEKRFIFSGSATAFGGRIRRPDNVFLKSAAPAYLPVTGGLSEAKLEGRDTEPHHYKDLIKFTAARSRAHGDFSDVHRAVEYTRGNHGSNYLPANTSVETRLEGLHIDSEADNEHNTPRRIFQARELEVHMESTTNRRGPISFRSLSVKFEGITLTTATPGAPSTSTLKVFTACDIFSENDTKAKMMETYANDGEFRSKYAACFHPIGAHLPGLVTTILGKHKIPHGDHGPFVATFVTKLEWVGGVAPEGTEILNNRLTIRGLGRVYFGEIVVDENSRRVSLLRFELGSPKGGELTAGEAASNGTHVPPLDPPPPSGN